jgi:hypothetical protein
MAFPLGDAGGVLLPDNSTLGGERPRRGGDAIGARRNERPGSDAKCQIETSWNASERRRRARNAGESEGGHTRTLGTQAQESLVLPKTAALFLFVLLFYFNTKQQISVIIRTSR